MDSINRTAVDDYFLRYTALYVRCRDRRLSPSLLLIKQRPDPRGFHNLITLLAGRSQWLEMFLLWRPRPAFTIVMIKKGSLSIQFPTHVILPPRFIRVDEENGHITLMQPRAIFA